MIAVNMREQPGTKKVVLAENQPQYTPLPALVTPSGIYVTEWQLTAEEIALLAAGGVLRMRQHVGFQRCETCGPRLFQPVSMEIVAAPGRLPLEPAQ